MGRAEKRAVAGKAEAGHGGTGTERGGDGQRGEQSKFAGFGMGLN